MIEGEKKSVQLKVSNEGSMAVGAVKKYNSESGIIEKQQDIPSSSRRYFLYSLSTDKDTDLQDINGNSSKEPTPTSYHIPENTIFVTSAVRAVPSSPSFSSEEVPPNNERSIPRAISITPSWMEMPIFTKCPSITFGRFLNNSLILIICIIVISVLVQVFHRNTVNIVTNQPSQMSSMAPSMSPLLSGWQNDTQININANEKKANLNLLMGYSVSLSGDGNILAVGGHKTFHLYRHLEGSNNGSGWVKVFDLSAMESAENITKNLSYRTVVAISSDGHYVAVGDPLATDEFKQSGAVMVFSNFVDGDEIAQWYQVGRTLHTSRHWGRFGRYLAIADGGNRLAVTAGVGDVFFSIHDYNGSEWTEKMTMGNNIRHDGYMTISPNGKFASVHQTYHNVVDIYELATFTKVQTLLGIGFADFGYSMSFSYDGTILAISTWSLGLVDLFRFNPDLQRYLSISDPISVGNVTGLGHSVSVSSNGKYIAVGAVSHPSNKIIEEGEFDEFRAWSDKISERGEVFVFRIVDNDWEEVGKFEHDKALYDKIGWSVSISGSGDVIAFGGYGTGGEFGDGPNKSGQVSIYRGERIM